MARCLISFGANLGDPRSSVKLASDLLKEMLPPDDRFRMSRLFQTPSVGGPAGQPPFVNAVAAVETQLGPWDVWQLIRSIEQKLGRQRIRRWEARRIDMDILLYEDVRIWTAQLKIPHPRMCMRRFILLPAMDVACDWRDPVSQWTIEQLASQVSSGKGSLLLITEADWQPETILREVAQATHAITPAFEQFQFESQIDDSQRSVGWMRAQDFFHRLSRHSKHNQSAAMNGPAKLTFFLESASPSSPWEEQHRELAIKLRLCRHDASFTETSRSDNLGYHSSENSSAPNVHRSAMAEEKNIDENWNGPRYLLATHDRDWAIHEIVSALDAMDCPVEPLSPG